MVGDEEPEGQNGMKPLFSKARSLQDLLTFLHYGLGILVTMGAYSFLQERIVAMEYEGETFRATMFLVLCNRLASILYALLMICCKQEPWHPQTLAWKYLLLSSSNMLSTWCQYESLRYVSLVLQTMAKTFKMLPVMVVGMLMSQKRHSFLEMLTVGQLTVGLSLFVAGGDVGPGGGHGSTAYGICLLLCFLGFDSFTSNFQEKLFKEDHMSKYNQMLYMNLSSATVSSMILLLTGMLPYCLAFLARSNFSAHVLTLSVSAALGQFYIFSMVQSFGALALAAAMNLRQVLTILLASLEQPKPMGWLQRVGVLLLCTALCVKVLGALGRLEPPKAADPDVEQQPLEMSQAIGAKS